MHQNGFQDPFAEETLDLKKIIRKYLHLWPWFVLSLVAAVAIAWFTNAFKPKIYENHLTLLIHEDDPLLQLDNGLFTAVSVSNTRLQNEKGILTSRSLANSTVSKMDFGIEYYRQQRFADEELYPNTYFTVEFDSLWPQAVNVPIMLRLDEQGTWIIYASWEEASLYSFASSKPVGRTGEQNFTISTEAGQWVEHPNLRFRIIENPEKTISPDDQFVVYFRDINTLTARYRNLEVAEISNSTMLRMTVQGSNRTKNARFLNMHAHMFLQRELDKKNYRAQKTIDFIEEQLDLVSQSLNHSETNLENFRASGQILNLDFQAQQTFTRLEGLQQELSKLMVKEKYYQYLENYLDQVGDSGADLIAPSSLGVDDPLLSELIVELMNLYTERSEVMINSRRDNPYLSNLESRIQITKNTVRESLRNIMNSNKMAMTDLENRISDLSERISTIPESQRHLFNMERQFTLHDNLFTLLQSRKSEVEIARAGFTPVHEIIDPAIEGEGFLISPKPRMSYYLAAFAGLLIPVMLIFLYDFFNDRVRSPEDVEKLTEYPILGHINRNGSKSMHLVSFQKQSIQAECFRSLRTNAQFVLPHDKVPVILVTSTLLEEGKTFTSLNLAASYASMGKKAVLLSLDLRKPKLHKYLDNEMQEGLSNYLSSGIEVEQVIRKGPVDNLDIIFSGQIPPNPAELLNSPKLAQLFEALRLQYDIIVVDSPPVGMVADTLLLLKYANAVVYIVRHNSTPTRYLQTTLRNLKEKGVKNLNIVLNDVPVPGRFSYYSSYGYQYGYFEKESVN